MPRRKRLRSLGATAMSAALTWTPLSAPAAGQTAMAARMAAMRCAWGSWAAAPPLALPAIWTTHQVRRNSTWQLPFMCSQMPAKRQLARRPHARAGLETTRRHSPPPAHPPHSLTLPTRAPPPAAGSDTASSSGTSSSFTRTSSGTASRRSSSHYCSSSGGPSATPTPPPRQPSGAVHVDPDYEVPQGELGGLHLGWLACGWSLGGWI